MPTAPSHRFRIPRRFSLRTLLISMLIIGGSLAAYRWPYQETVWVKVRIEDANDRLWWLEETPQGELRVETKTVTSYRRQWRDIPNLWRLERHEPRVQDGPERMYVEGLLVREAHYRNGRQHGVTRCYNLAGELTEETHYHNDWRHGPHRIGDGKRWTRSGTFHEEQQDGAWQVLEDRQLGERLGLSYWEGDSFVSGNGPKGADWVADDHWQVHQQWKRGQRVGRWQWRSPGGELLQTADYDDTEQLTHWNGQAVAEPFWEWIERTTAGDSGLSPVLRLKETDLHRPGDDPNIWRWLQGCSDFWFILPGQTGSSRQCAVIHCDFLERVDLMVEWNQSLGLNLLESALLSGLTMDYRYGALWLTPAHDIGDGFRDETGVTAITFPPDSPEARGWEEPVKLYEKQSLGPVAWMQYLLTGSPFELDSGDIQDREAWRKVEPDELYCVRSRRDAIGLILYRAGLQCELRGNKLLLKPHWSGSRSFERLDSNRIGGHLLW